MRYLRGQVEQRRMRIPIGISAFNPASTLQDQFNAHFEEFTALIDTGAQRTCVTQNVVDKLGLQRRGRIEIGNVRNRALHWTYLFQVAIWPEVEDDTPPVLFGLGDEVEGADLGDSRYFDVLLGMDILQLGSLRMDLGGRFELGFPG